MERRGIPTATLCTDEFAALAKRECGALGLPEMPLIVLPHPTSTLSGVEAQQKAEAVVDDIIEVLTREATALATAYAERQYTAPRRTLWATPSSP